MKPEEQMRKIYIYIIVPLTTTLKFIQLKCALNVNVCANGEQNKPIQTQWLSILLTVFIVTT